VYGVDEVTVKARLANSSAVVRALEQNYSGVQRDAGLEGTVDLQMTVERNGHTSSIVVVRSSDAAFNTAAVNVARAMRFSPASGERGTGPCAHRSSDHVQAVQLSDTPLTAK
jgi:TonB family protein